MCSQLLFSVHIIPLFFFFSVFITMTDSKDSGVDSLKKNESITSSTGFHIQKTSSLITPERLNCTNYIEWSLNAQNKIRGRIR